MKAIRVHEAGGPDVLRYEEMAQPEPGTGQVLIRIHAIGVNFVDVYQRTGLYSVERPFTPGQEAAGTVEVLGAGVRSVQRGDRVGYVGITGAYAQYAVVPGDRLVRLPDAVTARQAAALLLQGITAHYLTTSTYALERGDVCVVHAAAGGVGLLLCQIAKRRGARVIGTTSTAEKAALARAAGADEVILYTEQDFAAAVQRLTNGAGARVIYDSVGKTTLLKGLDCLARRGMMVSFGQSSGPVGPIDPHVLSQKGSLFLTRPTLKDYIATPAELSARAQDLFGWVAARELQVRVDREFPLAAAPDAHRLLESRGTSGKVLLIP